MQKENNPGRPVINSFNCRTFEISRFVDHKSKRNSVRVISSYIKDTNDFVNKINNFKVLENSFLVTMDIHTKQRRYCCCQTKRGQLHKENRSHKSDNKILSTYFNSKQVHF